MSSAKNKTMIGAFVAGAVGLVIMAVFLLGSGMFFSAKYPMVLYFEGSVGGLSVGAPVVFRGVQIGQVKDIRIKAATNPLRFSIPVVIELAPDQVEVSKGSVISSDLSKSLNMTREELFKELIDLGLRGQLSQKSFVTGELQIMLDFFPDTPAVFRGDHSMKEIPTVPSAFERIAKSIESLPLNELVNKIMSAVDGVNTLVNSKATQSIPSKFDSMLDESRDLLGQLGKEVTPLIKRIEDTLSSYDKLARTADSKVAPLADSYTDLANTMKARLNELSGEAKVAMDRLDKTLLKAQDTLGKLERTVGADSPTVTDFRKALNDVAAMARSIRAFADFLERHPEALIQGKGPRR